MIDINVFLKYGDTKSTYLLSTKKNIKKKK